MQILHYGLCNKFTVWVCVSAFEELAKASEEALKVLRKLKLPVVCGLVESSGTIFDFTASGARALVTAMSL